MEENRPGKLCCYVYRLSGRAHCAPYLSMTLMGFPTLLPVEACMPNEDIYRLPRPAGEQEACLSRILQARRTIRSFATRSLSQMQVARLLWAAQGVTSPEGYRTAPSAGATYPLELHLVAGNIEGVPAESYRYDPARHALAATVRGDLRQRLAESALNQRWIANAPAVVAHDLQAIHVAACIGGVARGDAEHLRPGVAVGCDPGSDQAMGALAVGPHGFADTDMVIAVTVDLARQLGDGFGTDVHFVVDVQAPDSALHQGEIGQIARPGASRMLARGVTSIPPEMP
jgi:hypothetical protein